LRFSENRRLHITGLNASSPQIHKPLS
jgi:hypothetical protein